MSQKGKKQQQFLSMFVNISEVCIMTQNAVCSLLVSKRADWQFYG